MAMAHQDSMEAVEASIEAIDIGLDDQLDDDDESTERGVQVRCCVRNFTSQKNDDSDSSKRIIISGAVLLNFVALFQSNHDAQSRLFPFI